MYLIIKGNLISRKYRINYNNEPKRFSVHYIDSPVKDININSYDFDNFYAYYEKNILDIININKIYDSKLILSTQKISSDHWLNPYLKVINSFTLKICKENNIICINLHENITFDDKVDLYDGIHTTPSGSEKVGETIAELFNKLISS